MDEELIKEATTVYQQNFNGDVWFGRCIFLSFYCERGSCDFCFRSVAKHQERHAQKARRSLSSILAEALIIKAFDWRIEFLTGGYGILDDEELLRTVRLVHQALGEKLWVNLGEIQTGILEEFRPYVKGIVSSIETINPVLHKKVCPDKPIAPYEAMMVQAQQLGYDLGMTLVIGLGESKEDFSLLKTFIKKHQFSRITIYALRPVKGTPYTKGPSSEEMVWWIAQVRIAFPHIEIIAGSAEYRRTEIPLLLTAGANAITKLPATKFFNTKAAREIETSIKQIGRHWKSSFTHNNPLHAVNWEERIKVLDLNATEQEELRTTLYSYLNMMDKQQQ
jgi:biotin synthase-like enzyme